MLKNSPFYFQWSTGRNFTGTHRTDPHGRTPKETFVAMSRLSIVWISYNFNMVNIFYKVSMTTFKWPIIQDFCRYILQLPTRQGLNDFLIFTKSKNVMFIGALPDEAFIINGHDVPPTGWTFTYFTFCGIIFLDANCCLYQRLLPF
jgi:hypothetical protein